MTTTEIKTLRLTPDQLFKRVSVHYSIVDDGIRNAICEHPTIEEMVTDSTNQDDKYGYAKDYILEAVKFICNAYKRNNPMRDDEMLSLVDMMLPKMYGYSIYDIKLFALLLVGAELPVRGRNGVEESTLKAVDAPSILERLKIYDERRKRLRFDLIDQCEARKREDERAQRPLEQSQYTNTLFSGVGNVDNPEAYWKSLPTKYEVEMMTALINHKISLITGVDPYNISCDDETANKVRSAGLATEGTITVSMVRSWLAKYGLELYAIKSPFNDTKYIGVLQSPETRFLTKEQDTFLDAAMAAIKLSIQ